jgi:prepilin-type N-terminal cleavage/methylation domain-containing protein/prepilin-type processing-associated H-X9-DG protein
MRKAMSKHRAFTLVELLVVVGIIAILIAILLPMMGKARQSGRRAACMGQLRDVGNLFQMYLNENRLRVPRVNPMPSQQPPLVNAPSIYQVLDRYTKGQRSGYRCPADQITQSPIAGIPVGFETYFDREGGSYEYNVFFNAFAFDPLSGVNKVWPDALGDSKKHGRTPDKLVIFKDFEPFHAKSGTRGALNCLFADFHVGDFLN